MIHLTMLNLILPLVCCFHKYLDYIIGKTTCKLATPYNFMTKIMHRYIMLNIYKYNKYMYMYICSI